MALGCRRDEVKNKMKFCEDCGKYTMKAECCGKETKNPHPLKYSTKDYAAKYRRRKL